MALHLKLWCVRHNLSKTATGCMYIIINACIKCMWNAGGMMSESHHGKGV